MHPFSLLRRSEIIIVKRDNTMSVSKSKTRTARATKLISIAINSKGEVTEHLDAATITTVAADRWIEASATAYDIAANMINGSLLPEIYQAYKADITQEKKGINSNKKGYVPHLSQCLSRLGVSSASVITAYRTLLGFNKARKQACWKEHCASLTNKHKPVPASSFTVNNIYRGYMALKGAKSGSTKSNENKRGRDTATVVPAVAREEIKTLKKDRKVVSDSVLASRQYIAKAIKAAVVNTDLDTCPDQNIALINVLNWCKTGKWEEVKLG